MIRPALLAVFILLQGQACFAASNLPRDLKRVDSDWRLTLHSFKVGLGRPAPTGAALENLQAFAKALQHEMGLPVRLVFAGDQIGLLQAFLTGKIDYAVFSATAFSSAWTKCKCTEPLVTAKADDGARGFHSVLISRNDKVRSVNDLQGRVVIIPGQHSFAGYIHPKFALSQMGIKLGEQDWPISDHQNMEAAVHAFSQGKADAMFGWVSMENRSTRGTLHRLRQLAKSNYKIVWKSELIPHGPHTVRKDLNGEAKVLLATFLLRLAGQNPKAYDAIEPVFGGGFAQSVIEDYDIIIRFMATEQSLK